VVEIDECHVLTPALFALSQALREPLMDLMPKDWICGLTLTETAAGHDVLISNLPEEAAGSAFGPDWMQANGVARISAEDRGAAEPIAQAAQPSVTLGDMAVAFPAGAFLQATVDAEAALQRAVLDFTGGAARVADLFCGLGTFGSVLAANSRVTAVDASGPSVSALAAAAGAQSLPIKTLHRDLFRRPLSPKELSAFDAVVLDPPRAGARLQCEMAAKAELGRLAYVSCNPATFARDAEILVAGGFTLKEVRPVAQFRWSTHVELAARFER
jgi:23S rRNA (uracil1939-C5)-methyltransferase